MYVLMTMMMMMMMMMMIDDDDDDDDDDDNNNNDNYYSDDCAAHDGRSDTGDAWCLIVRLSMDPLNITEDLGPGASDFHPY